MECFLVEAVVMECLEKEKRREVAMEPGLRALGGPTAEAASTVSGPGDLKEATLPGDMDRARIAAPRLSAFRFLASRFARAASRRCRCHTMTDMVSTLMRRSRRRPSCVAVLALRILCASTMDSMACATLSGSTTVVATWPEGFSRALRASSFARWMTARALASAVVMPPCRDWNTRSLCSSSRTCTCGVHGARVVRVRR